MARRCELTGTGVQTGNNVSHAQNKTRRRFLPNLCDVTLASEKLGRNFKLRVAAKALRSVDHSLACGSGSAERDAPALVRRPDVDRPAAR